MKKNKLPYHHKPGFKIPQDYFEDFEDRLMDSIAGESNLPGINVYIGKPGFEVPSNYFNALEDRIFERLEEKDTVKVIPLFSKQRLYYAAAIAAVFIGIVSLVYFKPVGSESTINSLELSALENYIDEGHFDLNYYEITSLMYEEGYSFDNFSTSGFSDEAIYNYVNENIENPDLLFE
ncbi:hypothetical protein BH23BAC2_BH23BAC2_12380 [soil metagenome]